MSANTSYNDGDLAAVERIKAWLAEHEKSRSWLSKKANIPSGTISQILNGNYTSSPSRQLGEMLQVVGVETERLSDGTPGYVKGKIHKLISVVCDRTRKHANFGLVSGHVGVGKTRTLEEYRATHSQTALIMTNPNMTPGTMLRELLSQLNTPEPSGLDKKFDAAVRALKGRVYLIIVDEAEKASATTLEYLRRIRDKAQVGVVLAGTEKLETLIQPQHGQFDQIRSRVGMWPDLIKQIDRDDADDMARVALQPDFGELADEVLDTLWAYGAGSARVLMEVLVPAIRDFGHGKGALSPALIKTIAARVANMKEPTVRKGGA